MNAPARPPALSPALATEVERLVDARMAERLREFSAVLPSPHGATRADGEGTSLLIFSGDFDRLVAAFTIALSAAATGTPVSMYFSFWGLSAIRRRTTFARKTLAERVIGVLLPAGPAGTPTSRMNLGGIGPWMFRRLMRRRHIASLSSMVAIAQELGVTMIACEMSMQVMGVTREELIDGVTFGGASTYVAAASRAKITLFI